ncbi:MAG: KH domain-containing protein [Patescibacteria group bacterium]
MAEQDVAFLEHVVKSLVDAPDAVKINRTVDEMGVLLTLDVDPNDMGKVIGRSGNTAKAIRTLLRVVGMKNNARVNLKINEPAGSTRGMGESGMRGGMRGGSTGASSRSVDEAIEELKNS